MESKPKPRWRFSYRLRTVFLLVAAIGMFFGWFIVPRETRRQARNALIARGVSADLEDDPNDPLPYWIGNLEPPKQPFWVRWWYGTLPATYTRRVHWVQPLHERAYTEIDFQDIARLGPITWRLDVFQPIENPEWLDPIVRADNIHHVICFWRCQADRGVLEQISKLKNVKSLHFEDVPLDAERLALIAKMKQLESLTLTRTGCGNDAMKHVAQLTRLTRLELREPTITDDGMKQLATLTELETLEGEVGAGDEGFACLAKMPKLKYVRLNNTPITDRCLAHLAPATGMRDLRLESSAIDGSGLRHLAGMRRLRSINLSGTQTKTGLATLAKFSELDFVDLSRTPIEDKELAALGKSKSLNQVIAMETAITDEGLLSLATIPTLTLVRTDRSRVTAEGRAKLKTVFPNMSD